MQHAEEIKEQTPVYLLRQYREIGRTTGVSILLFQTNLIPSENVSNGAYYQSLFSQKVLHGLLFIPVIQTGTKIQHL